VNLRPVITALWCASLSACGAELTVPDEHSVRALPARVADPDDNPSSAAKIELGRLLFWDPILSGNRDVACATCHHPDFAYADGRARSLGVGGTGLGPLRRPGGATHETPRNSMTVLNSAYNGITQREPDAAPAEAPMFWDNRVKSLETQALQPIQNASEMRGEALGDSEILPEVLRRLQAIPAYVEGFAASFGADPISEQNVARAIAAFERSLVTRESSFDRFLGGDEAALSHAAKRGLAAFLSDGCSRCHSGPMLSDFELHRLNVPGADADIGNDGTPRMRTPSLRNVLWTAPYMRNGQLSSLADVLDFYVDEIDTSLDPDLPNRFPERGVEVFLPFFESLSDAEFDRTIPPEVPSGLPVGGDI
jgi:cytochrome c peroxidase